jgi:hypothetical protein
MNEFQKPLKQPEKWWKSVDDAESKNDCDRQPMDGEHCPSCLIGYLGFNGLFQLICDTCGRVAEHSVFT